MAMQRLETEARQVIPDENLRNHMGRIEEEIKRHEWPMRSNLVVPLFSHVFGLDEYDVRRIVQAVRKRAVMEFIRKEFQDGFFSYFFAEDHVRALGALCWVIQTEPLQRGRVIISLDDVAQKAKEALGNHPLRDLICDPLSNKPKKTAIIALPLFAKNIDPEEALIDSIEERMRERPVSGKIPPLEKKELERASFWTPGKLKVLLAGIPNDVTEEVSYARIPLVEDDWGILHSFHHPEAQMVMFISAVVAPDGGKMARFDPRLEDLNYRQLQLGLTRCISAFEKLASIKDLHIKNLTELFLEAIKARERRNVIASNVLAGSTAGS